MLPRTPFRGTATYNCYHFLRTMGLIGARKLLKWQFVYFEIIP